MDSPQKRNLTDELQSVLRAHSLDAPEPAASIENVLARTVGAGARASAPTPSVRHRWFAPNRILLASAAAAAVVAALISVPLALTAGRQSGHTASRAENGPIAFDSAAKVPNTSGLDARGGGLAAAPSASPPMAAMAGVRACTPADLAVSLVTSRAKAPTVATIMLRNVSTSSCLIAGFPAVQPVSSQQDATAYSLPLPTASPGVQAEAVQTLVLAPNTAAAAAIDAGPTRASDSYAAADACDVKALDVTLPTGGEPTRVPFTSPYCTFAVHPLVAATK